MPSWGVVLEESRGLLGVMVVVGIEIMREREGRLLSRYSTHGATVPRGYCSRDGGCEGKRAAARVGGAGNADRGASPTAGKREEISF